ncbi:hypothetical protein [Orrella daihaiensis]|uniref:DUF3828 domain-containing protein n=1 Tax=Orrella daihaiensis TaxID=2782176 RepID=A0ABY4ALZ0_9BURK|nr:hypothetical protein [Orrella daihaiensis]UOD51287.1 hypothetical protein DHf2319_05205 [Orrella daihaiensis]
MTITGRQLLASASIILIALTTLGLAGCAPLAPGNAAPSTEQSQQQSAVKGFFEQVLNANVYGLPTDTALEQFKPWISPALFQRFEQAQVQQTLDLARHQGTEPPMLQGSPFVSLFEGATGVVAVTPAQAPDTWAVSLVYRANAGQSTTTVQWTDTVALTQQDGRWVVNDVIFGGQWDFAKRGRLSELLDSVRAAGS